MKIKRMLSCVLALLLLLSGTVALFSCGKDDGTAQESESEAFSDTDTADSSETEAQTEEVKEPLKLIENGKSEYVVVYPNEATPTVLGAVDLLIEKIKEKTGVTLKSKSDNLRGAAAHDPNEKAILIGRTNYEESEEVFASLGRFEYKIAQVGNKMVVMALSETYVQTAVNYYVTHLLERNITGGEGAKTLTLEEFHYIPEDASPNEFKINGTEIAEFAIVYPKSDPTYKILAMSLQSAIVNSTSVEVPVYADDEEEREHEILFGKTNRAFSRELYESATKTIATYSVEVSGSKLQIFSGGYASAKQCISQLRFSALNNGKTEYTDGSYLKTNMFADKTALMEDADLRIMTANILNPAWVAPGDRDDVAYCAEILAGILANTQPDAIGLQEAAGEWKTELEEWFPILKEEYGVEYTWHHRSYNDGTNNYVFDTSIVYRSDLYDCVEDDVLLFSHASFGGSTSNSMRIITKCHLQSKTDDTKEFIMLNTHWDGQGVPEVDYNCTHESAAFVNELKNEGCPIFFTGDFNSVRGAQRLEEFITEAGVQTIDQGAGWIDFTFFWGDGVTAKGNETFNKADHYNITDHPLRYTDFDLSW
ncbi:MAG: hypothetical protein E7668_02385 [Ruminococcaceae bacterium]|nr:hypothetical protein [Oscillospiraceae bacterium]